MDWKRFLAELYDNDQTRLHFLDPIDGEKLRELESVSGPVPHGLGDLLRQTNGVLKQWLPPGKSAPDGWEDSDWLVWSWDEIKEQTVFHRGLITEDEDDGFDPGTLVFFTHAGLASVTYGCNYEGEVWLWGPTSGEFERRFIDLETFFRADARNELYG